ncbi:MAG: aminotransferase class V-fold PLP-dependent enzyme, partial [Aeoliella sp.]
MRRVYLDYNATTPIAPEVRETMQSFLAEHFGNPSSDHSLGRASGEAISDAREQLAGLIGADPAEMIFTGGGTESNNAALKGVFLGDISFLRGHLIISAVEHPAITVPTHYLKQHGVDVTIVPCDGQGFVDPEAVAQAIR